MAKLRQKVSVGLVGGSDFPKLQEQMGGDNGGHYLLWPKEYFVISRQSIFF